MAVRASMSDLITRVRVLIGDTQAAPNQQFDDQTVQDILDLSRVNVRSALLRPAADCDGQVLVIDDMLGMFERTPRFVKRYDDLAARISDAAAAYAKEVRSRAFPTPDQTYRPKP